jgi:hypothetical protein
MAAKLRSITKPIPWSLLLKAITLSVLWGLGKASLASGMAMPFWLFILFACAAYFLPLFRPRSLLVPFLCVMIFAISLPFSWLAALAFGAAFFLILGIKDLVLVDRETAYESLLFLLSFLAVVSTYRLGAAWGDANGWLAVLGASLLILLLLRKIPWQEPPRERQDILPVIVFGFLALQLGLVLLFLPLDFLYQASILFLFAVFAVYSLIRIRRSEASFQMLLYYFLAFVLASGFILALNSWRI